MEADMHVTSALLLIMLLGIALTPFFVIYQLTSLAHSSYRNRLWILRDKITDDLRRGKIARSHAAQSVQNMIEEQIQVAGRHTIADSLLAIAIFKVDGDTSVFEDILGAGETPEDQQILVSYLRDYRVATAKHLMWGSTLGWLLSLVLYITKSLVWIFSRVQSVFRATDKGNSSRATVVPSQGDSRKQTRGDVDRQPARRPERQGTGHAREIRQKIERAEVEIMPTATPRRHRGSMREFVDARA
ncbi:hypothetical protein [Micromonospora sp. C95]|uniref:hypothetical protein n=1 Tax=Micromonospora sp. C95 TaxID=2824882 RepID=UPI001B382AE1|nr:hypothetical protein [Micromonospora sp. C95]MBQ1025469.1 hypothetical protein [Micromonospora sp. C95]